MDGVVRDSRDMIRRGSRSFAAAARLFDPVTRQRAWMLYAWCRYCDDQIDGQALGMPASPPAGGTDTPGARLQRLMDETRHALNDDPGACGMDDPTGRSVFAAFRRVARECGLPERYPLELLRGFGMDVEHQRYQTLDDTLLYCYRVAGVVGVMMAYVMGVSGRPVLQRAADLGIAFQLTNIARDVADDALAGRCYLPAEWLADEGLVPGRHCDPARRQALAAVVTRVLDEADRYYESASTGLRFLPFRSAWAIATALRVYRDIGGLVRARGEAAWAQRTVVPRRRKLVHGIAGTFAAARARWVDRHREEPGRAETLWTAPELGG